MKFIGHIFSFVWKVYFLLLFVVTLLFFFPAFFILLQKRKWYPIVFKIQKVWAATLLFLSGIIYSVKYRHPIETNKTYVICSNHFSYLDIVLLYRVIPFYFVFMAKKELRSVPLFGLFFKDMNIAVDRSSAKASHLASLQADKELKMGNSVVIFPEGTIGTTVPKMRPFKNGAFKLAIDNKIAILPITFLNNHKLLTVDPFFPSSGRPGKAMVIVHKPIETKSFDADDMLLLKTKVEHVINQSLLAYDDVKSNKK